MSDHDPTDLTALSDADLLALCMVCVRAYRRLPQGPERMLAWLTTHRPWYECCRRGRHDLYRQALAQIRQEERQAREENREPFGQEERRESA